jgi:DNA-binding NarL/FixJ family response regulator
MFAHRLLVGMTVEPMQTSTRKRIFMVDDHPVVRRGIATLLEGADDLGVCGESDGTDDVLSRIVAERPDLVIMDIGLKGTSGLDLVRKLRERDPSIRCLVLSIYEERLYEERARKAGAVAYVRKDVDDAMLMAAIRTALDGHSWRRPDDDRTNGASRDDDGAVDGVRRLSQREVQVFEMLGRGLSPREIAVSLGVSIKTVETHREHIKTKLGIPNGPQLVVQAARYVLEQA